MLAAVHGVFDRSIWTLMSPRLVWKVSTWKPLCGTAVGGVPMSLMPGGRERVGLAPGEALLEALAEPDGPGSGVGRPARASPHWQPLLAVGVVLELPPPVAAAMIQMTAPRTTTAATPAPIRACSTRLRRA